MGERVNAPGDATTEAVATTGLFSLFTAIIAVAVCLAGIGSSDVIASAVAGVVAVASFVASIVCFSMQARERVERTPVPAQVQPAPAAA
ncbi:hypothetical protein ACN27E_18800 [Mycobacterium sp. WMMD1722]|uniref:hypothetical protein n=1 Tax=Mycobacterium sp. WMMD1722 TaxID=3404117 RepID=UPI003BF588DB